MKKWYVLLIISIAAISTAILVYSYMSPWNATFTVKGGKIPAYTLVVNSKKVKLFQNEPVKIKLNAGTYTATLCVEKNIVSERIFYLPHAFFQKATTIVFRAPNLSKIAIEKAKVYGKKLKIEWKEAKKGIHANYFDIYVNGKYATKTTTHSWFTAAKANAIYEIVPIYPENIHGKGAKFVLPKLTPLVTVTRNVNYHGVKLHEGLNEVILKEGILERYATVTLDTIPPKIMARYALQKNGVKLILAANEKCRYEIKAGNKTFETSKNEITVPYAIDISIRGIDIAGNVSTPLTVHVSIPSKLKIESAQEKNGVLTLKWNVEYKTVIPKEYEIERNSHIVAMTKKNVWKGKYTPGKYVILPIYKGGIVGEKLSFVLPKLTPLATVTRNANYHGIKLHEGLNEVILKEGILERYATVTLDTIPPKIMARYALQKNGVKLILTANEKCRYEIKAGNKAFETSKNEITVPYATDISIRGIDIAGNVSTPVKLLEASFSKILYKPIGRVIIHVKSECTHNFFLVEGISSTPVEFATSVKIKIPATCLIDRKVKLLLWSYSSNKGGKFESFNIFDPTLLNAKPLSFSQPLRNGIYYANSNVAGKELKILGDVVILMAPNTSLSFKKVDINGILTIEGLDNCKWNGIVITAPATLKNLCVKDAKTAIFTRSHLCLENAEFEKDDTAVSLNNTIAVVHNSTFSSVQNAVMSYDSKTYISSDKFLNCDVGVNQYGGFISLKQSNFSRCENGVYISGRGSAVLEKNSFIGEYFGIYLLNGGTVHLISNSFKEDVRALYSFKTNFLSSLGDKFSGCTVGIELEKTPLISAFVHFENSKLALEVSNNQQEKVELDFPTFSKNRFSIFVKESGNVYLRGLETHPSNVFDGSTFPYWYDERGKKFTRGKVLLK